MLKIVQTEPSQIMAIVNKFTERDFKGTHDIFETVFRIYHLTQCTSAITTIIAVWVFATLTVVEAIDTG